MKKILLLGCVLCILFSCRQSEFEFSCDPVIDQYVKENRDELLTVSVTEFADFDLPLQKAVYNSWDAQKKRDAWISKIKHVLSYGSFTEPEILHLQKLISHINSNYFDEMSIQNGRESRYLFEDEWINYTADKLGWSDQYIAFLIYRLYTEQYQFNDELSMLRVLSSDVATNSEGSCTCNTSSDYCDTFYCHSGGCSTTSGCGWLWTEQCNGVCN